MNIQYISLPAELCNVICFHNFFLSGEILLFFERSHKIVLFYITFKYLLLQLKLSDIL